MKVTGIILAGGVGVRMESDLPKQFIEINGKPIILYSVETFIKNQSIDEIIIVCNKDNIDRLKSILKKAGLFEAVFKIVSGGETRQKSAKLGITGVSSDTDIILLHDSSRPFVTDKIIEEVSQAALKYGSATPVISVTDTIVTTKNDDLVEGIPPRETIKRVQTPQAFQYKIIIDAHTWAEEKGYNNFTDDCGIVIKKGEQVKMVPGDEKNIKVTSSIDLVSAEHICRKIY